jgi:hypothetical protein
MHNYHDANKHFPPAVVCDKEGRLLLSWRVLLLPYLDEEDLFKRFHLDEPWDSPHNIQLLDQMPDLFALPPWGTREWCEPHSSFYQVFVGSGAAFEGCQGMTLPSDFPDGSSNTILIVTASKAVPWAKPEDVTYVPDLPIPPLGVLMRYPTPQITTTSPLISFACADGGAHSVNAKHFSEKTLRALITRNGNDAPGPDWPW